MRNKKNGWLLIGILMGMIIGRLTIPEEVWGAGLIVAKAQTVIDDMSDPTTKEIEEAEAFLSETGVNVPEDIETLCKKYGKEYGIAPELLEAVCWKESWFKADATNGSCHGLMQISKGSHKKRMERLNVTDLYDPEQNIKTGADYLAELFDEYEDTATVLELYNGDGAAAADTERDSCYASKVMKVSQALERVHYK